MPSELRLTWSPSSPPHALKAAVARVRGAPCPGASRWRSRPSSARGPASYWRLHPQPFQPQPWGEGGAQVAALGLPHAHPRGPDGGTRHRPGRAVPPRFPADSGLPGRRSFRSSGHGASFGKKERKGYGSGLVQAPTCLSVFSFVLGEACPPSAGRDPLTERILTNKPQRDPGCPASPRFPRGARGSVENTVFS